MGFSKSTTRSIINAKWLRRFLAVGLLVSCAPESPKLKLVMIEANENIKNKSTISSTFNRMVDILIVVDDSGSMADKQANLEANIQKFTQAMFQNQTIDFHIGVTTTTMRAAERGHSGSWGGRLVENPTVITKVTPDFLMTLRAHLLVGTDGSATEEHFDVIKGALSSPVVNTENRGFLRNDAVLAIFTVSDAEPETPHADPDDLYKFLLALKGGDANKLLMYSAYIPTTDRTCSRSGESEPVLLERLQKLMKAQTFSLCDPDFGTKLANIGADIVSKVSSVLYLSRVPIVDTIRVTFGSQVIPNDFNMGWVYDPTRNALVLGKDLELDTKQPQGTKVDVSFTATQY